MGTVKELKELEERAEKILEDLLEQIEALPDNPRIKRLNDNPRCFVLQFSDTGNNLSAEHHDFKISYSLIVKRLRQCSRRSVVPTLKKIIETKHVRVGNRDMWLHDDVIAHLEGLVKDD